MPARVDAELERVRKTGQTPRRIEVGNGLFGELHQEQNPVLIAALVGPNDKTPIHVDREVREYQGIQVYHDPNAEHDYLNIVV